MCGIVGYAGRRQSANLLLDGLDRLEYRGYDSSGIAVLGGGKITVVKTKGRLSDLRSEVDKNVPRGSVGIGHTRWATHGAPSTENAHPHLSNDGSFAVVHNGIIENHSELREFLTTRGFNFKSLTDTEVIPNLLEYYYDGDLLEAIVKTTHKLRGSYALGIIHAGEPDKFYAARKDSPLVIGIGDGENFIASDIPAILPYTSRFVMPDDGEIAVISSHGYAVFNKNFERVNKEVTVSELDSLSTEKGGYPHFMLKEIYEQPSALSKVLEGRTARGGVLSELTLHGNSFRKVFIAACGSAYHAGEAGKYFIEKYARLETETVLASEFRYRDPIVDDSCLTVIISQSGETADSLAALREAKRRGSYVLAIVNAPSSTIAREANETLYTRAGPEIAVATTKGYTTQLALIYLLGLKLARDRGTLPDEEFGLLLSSIEDLPENVEAQLKSATTAAQRLANKYSGVRDAYFIGRGEDRASALEGALKLKEISYVHAEAYAAGELKHGTISLIENGTLVLAIDTNPTLHNKTESNVREVKARGAEVVKISQDGGGDEVLKIPSSHPSVAPVYTAVVLQLFAYYSAVARGCDVDKPRNLAKAVTVE